MRKLKQYPQCEGLESEVLDEIERRLRAKLRQPKSIEYIFAFLDVVIARAVTSVVRHYLARAPTGEQAIRARPAVALPSQDRLLELRQLWDKIEQWVGEIDRAVGVDKELSFIYHLDVAGRTHAEIAQMLTSRVSCVQVTRRMNYLCRELARRICAFLGKEAEPLGRLPRGWQYRMSKALREMKENLED